MLQHGISRRFFNAAARSKFQLISIANPNLQKFFKTVAKEIICRNDIGSVTNQRPRGKKLG
jgi:hypothetical protein